MRSLISTLGLFSVEYLEVKHEETRPLKEKTGGEEQQFSGKKETAFQADR